MTLIAISGIDGAGKSTQLELLASELERRGRDVERLWFRPGYSRRLDRTRALIRRVRPSSLPRADRAEARAAVFATPGVSAAWMLAATLDTLIEYGGVVRRMLGRGRVVLCDRYLLDARLDLVLRFPELDPWPARLFAGLEMLCPRPDCQILLMISADEMRRRNQQAPEPFPDPPAIRAARHRAYRELQHSASVAVIDGAGDPAAVHRAILDRLEGIGS
jgi:thymidylate kinase